MTDVVDKHDGSEFVAGQEDAPKFSLVDRLGLDEIDPDSVGPEWQLTDNGVYVVDISGVKEGIGNMGISEISSRLSPLSGLFEASGDTREQKSIAYFAGPQFIRDWKTDLGLEGGFKVVGRYVDSERYAIPGRQFFEDRARGFWSIQTGKVGIPVTETARHVSNITHDIKLRDHLAVALAATDAQVEQIAALRAKCYELGGDERTNILVGKLMPAVLDEVFSLFFPDSLKLTLTPEISRRIRIWNETWLMQEGVERTRRNTMNDELMDRVDEIFSTAEDETRFEPYKEAQVAQDRLRVIRQSIGGFV